MSMMVVVVVMLVWCTCETGTWHGKTKGRSAFAHASVSPSVRPNQHGGLIDRR